MLSEAEIIVGAQIQYGWSPIGLNTNTLGCAEMSFAFPSSGGADGVELD
jgi:hypothetical protein